MLGTADFSVDRMLPCEKAKSLANRLWPSRERGQKLSIVRRNLRLLQTTSRCQKVFSALDKIDV